VSSLGLRQCVDVGWSRQGKRWASTWARTSSQESRHVQGLVDEDGSSLAEHLLKLVVVFLLSCDAERIACDEQHGQRWNLGCWVYQGVLIFHDVEAQIELSEAGESPFLLRQPAVVLRKRVRVESLQLIPGQIEPPEHWEGAEAAKNGVWVDQYTVAAEIVGAQIDFLQGSAEAHVGWEGDEVVGSQLEACECRQFAQLGQLVGWHLIVTEDQGLHFREASRVQLKMLNVVVLQVKFFEVDQIQQLAHECDCPRHLGESSSGSTASPPP